ncbi:hypothetical protein KSP39_PZI021078 [Platanthera zijinensis]|uniref:Trichome birefringence-like N-terminal domain-containing protein n=1 Tax=Platanthera zijinensis TaxID=2320716 RepID=A0AAP0AYX4_9ASPA
MGVAGIRGGDHRSCGGIPRGIGWVWMAHETRSRPNDRGICQHARAREKPTEQSLLRRCNYTDGRWVPDRTGPLYNYTACTTIKPGQNCLANGRPDTGYLRWQWKPTGCRLPLFSPEDFLRLFTNKHLAFVGDSMARNQAESLLCLLAAAYTPELVYRDGEDNKFRRWVFHSHNATVSVYWSPFLVEGVEKSIAAGLGHNKLYLDVADKKWAGEMPAIDVVVLSAGHWFLHPAVFFEEGGVVGCHHCPELNHTEIGFFDVYRKAVRKAMMAAAAAGNKYVVAATFSPSHFEGEWDKAGACGRKKPYREGEKEMEYMDREMWKIMVEEVAVAAERESGRGSGGGGVRIEALDVTRMAMMRPDGHPGPYMNRNPFAGGPKERVQNDCVHWCLPGPIDAWNEILLEMIRTHYWT